jgi:hypothetical protein
MSGGGATLLIHRDRPEMPPSAVNEYFVRCIQPGWPSRGGVDNHLVGIAIRSSPQLAIQCAKADGFGDMICRDAIGAFEIGDGAGDFEDAIVGAGAEVVFGHGGLEHGER